MFQNFLTLITFLEKAFRARLWQNLLMICVYVHLQGAADEYRSKPFQSFKIVSWRICLVTEPGSLIFPRWKWAFYLLKSWISEIRKIHYTIYFYKKQWAHDEMWVEMIIEAVYQQTFKWVEFNFIKDHCTKLKTLNLHFLHQTIEISVFSFSSLVLLIHLWYSTHIMRYYEQKLCLVSLKFWRV